MTSRLVETLQRARTAAKLSPAELAALLDCNVALVEAIERGEIVDEWGSLTRRWAGLLGFLPWESGDAITARSPSVVLMRAHADSAASQGRLAASPDEWRSLWWALGHTQWVVRTAAQLAPETYGTWQSRLDLRRVAERALELGAVPAGVALADLEPVWRQGELLALAARECLGLGDEPIPSMRALMQDSLGIAVLVAPLEPVLPATVSAFAVASGGGAGVLLGSGAAHALRDRATLAHELAHFVADHDVLTGDHAQPLISEAVEDGGFAQDATRPKRRSRWMWVHERAERMERRANAFAAYFLAPRASVRRLLGLDDDGSGIAISLDAAIPLVCQMFGVGPTLAAQHIQNIVPGNIPALGGVSRDRYAKFGIDASRDWTVDQRSEDEAQFPPPWFAELVVKASREGRVSLSRAYTMLDEPVTQPLGQRFGLESGLGPLRDPDFDLLCRVQAFLADEGRNERAVRLLEKTPEAVGSVRMLVRLESVDGATRSAGWFRVTADKRVSAIALG